MPWVRDCVCPAGMERVGAEANLISRKIDSGVWWHQNILDSSLGKIYFPIPWTSVQIFWLAPTNGHGRGVFSSLQKLPSARSWGCSGVKVCGPQLQLVLSLETRVSEKPCFIESPQDGWVAYCRSIMLALLTIAVSEKGESFKQPINFN